MTGTLAEKVERDVRAYPDDYRATGQWLDDFSLLHGSRLKAKLLQKKKEFDESGIQKEANKLKRKARTTGTKTAKEAAERFARSCQSRKDDLTKLKKEIRAFDAYLKTPKGEPPVRNSVLIKEAWNNAYNEKPRDIKKILLIYWVLTDRLVDSDEPGLTLFEKWSYGDDRECAEPEEYFGTRHETLNEMISIDSKMIPTVEAAMRATTRNRETEQKVSGGKAENTKTKERIALKDFIKKHCDLSERPDINSKCEMLMREHRKDSIKLPLVNHKYRRGQTKLYYLEKLRNNWPDYRMTLTTLPPLKKSDNK
jgi:hypothetical protein